jgi:hypothetical protein
MAIRDTLNNGEANRLADAWRSINVGDLLNMLLAGATFTETGVAVTTNVATLANQPSALYIINATTATTGGVKQLLKGPITGPKALVPATGQAVWDGGKKVLFATADVVTVAKFLYAQAADVTASILQRTVGEIDSP